MARIDLSIVDRGTSGTVWTKEDVALTAEHLDDVMEQKTDNSGALNSLPTPFARFFVAREAFRRVNEEKLNALSLVTALSDLANGSDQSAAAQAKMETIIEKLNQQKAGNP